MKKKSLITLGGIGGNFIIAYFGLSLFLGHIVKVGVNSFAPSLTQTQVGLKAARISPFSGSGSLTRLTVGNPEGWSDNNAITLGKIHFAVQPFSIFGDHIVINEIIIDQPEFLYETKIIASNIKDLLKNIESFTGSGGEEPATKSGKPIKFVVKKFRMTNGIAKLGVGAAAIPLPLSLILMDDLGVAEGGSTPDQLVGAVMKNVLGGIVSATGKAAAEVGKTVGASTTEAVGNAAKKTGAGIKKLFGK